MSGSESGLSSSDGLPTGTDSLSMRDKSLLKRSMSKFHNNNFETGYVPVHEQYLSKSGLRGRKTLAFWALIFVVFMLAFVNLVLTITIMEVLGLGEGMENLELISKERAIRLFAVTDLGNIYKRNGKLEGFTGIPVEIISENGDFKVVVNKNYFTTDANLVVGINGITFNGTEYFQIQNKESNIVFSSRTQDYNNFPNLKVINSTLIESNRIASPLGETLKINADFVKLKGAEGTKIEGRRSNWIAELNVHLSSNKSITISGKDGISFHPEQLPNIYNHTQNDTRSTPQYKICVCMPQGKLYKLRIRNPRVTTYCNQVSETWLEKECRH